MDKFDRIYELHKILAPRRTPISLQELCYRLECKEATVKRAVRVLREMLNAPILNDRDGDGYYYDRQSGERQYELPGLWFTADELQALLTLQKVIEGLHSGLLGEHLAPFKERIEKLLSHKRLGLSEADCRIRVLSAAARTPGEWFEQAAHATLQRRRLEVRYEAVTRL
jgi:proteasome accessory factor C